MIITNPDPLNLREYRHKMTQDINDWFDANLLSLNLDKTHFMQFVTKNGSLNDFGSLHGNKTIAMVDNTKLLGLTLDNSLSWRPHIDTIVPKLSSASFALQVVKPLLSWDTLKMAYFSYFLSIMTYGILFWGTSRPSSIIFKLQKRAVRIIAGLRSRIPAENILGCSKYCHYSLNTYCPFYFLWSTTGTISG